MVKEGYYFGLPLLVLGAQSGLVFGEACGAIFPALSIQPEGFAVVGLAAFFAGGVPAPLTGIVLVSLFISNSRGEVPDKTDFKGIFLSSLSLGLLLFGFELISHEGEAPLALLDTEIGARQVEVVLGRIAHGVVS